MDNGWVAPILCLVVLFAAVGGLLFGLGAGMRYLIRRARMRWSLPPKSWSVLIAGLIIQASGVVIFTGAFYVSFLPARPFDGLFRMLLALGLLSMGLSGMLLVVWWVWALRAYRHLHPLEVYFGEDQRSSAAWVLAFIIVAGISVAVNTRALPGNSPLLGSIIGVMFTLDMVCVGGLLAHALKPGAGPR